MQRRDRVATMAVGLLLFGVARLAAADNPGPTTGYTLNWVSTATERDCPSAAARLVTAISGRLGFDPFSSGGRRRVEARYTRDAGGHRLELTFLDERGAGRSTRPLESSSDECSVIIDAASLAIAVAIQEDIASGPRVDTEGGAANDASDATPSALPIDAARPIHPVPTAPLERPTLGGRAAVSLGVVAGALPKVAAGLDVSGRIAIRNGIWASVGLLHVPEVSARDTHFKIGLDMTRAGLCLDPFRKPRFDIASCAHVNLGSTSVVVEGFVPVSPGSSFMGGGSLGQWVAFRPIPALALVVGEELTLPFPRYDLVLDGSGRRIFRASPVSSTTFFGIALSTPER